MTSLTIVIANKDRPWELKQLISNLRQQYRQPDAVVIVDASPSSNTGIDPFRGDLKLSNIHYPYPSAALQGLSCV